VHKYRQTIVIPDTTSEHVMSSAESVQILQDHSVGVNPDTTSEDVMSNTERAKLSPDHSASIIPNATSEPSISVTTKMAMPQNTYDVPKVGTYSSSRIIFTTQMSLLLDFRIAPS
jgi:hypothetical protein